ncbi:SNase-domain-containing protein [Hygrophoropsis aurantiaca]|uniref:SNase-domain-containing protein n=1 Tax=Hygrophoropsis aurantiaca TaxID=72124 RepID=A0ACB8AGL1_9AGAM|nr:SNase-domain-containing protein [Hygrophoropsis aurantiaca]
MRLLPWKSESEPNRQSPKAKDRFVRAKKKVKDRLHSKFAPQVAVIALSAFALGSVSTIAATITYRRYLCRLRTSEWITPDILKRRRWIKGVVTSVGDADNFRLYHTPGIGWRWPLKVRRIPPVGRELKDQTIHIRIAGVDAPEAAHFGRPAQPYAAESLSWLKDQIEGKTVYCQLLRRDQYSRIVALVTRRPRLLPGFLVPGKILSLEMLRAGWATTYEQAGAEYGPVGKDEFLKVEATAKAARRGMWTSGTSAETPAEYKRRYTQTPESAAQSQLNQAGQSKDASTPVTTSWLKRLWT